MRPRIPAVLLASLFAGVLYSVTMVAGAHADAVTIGLVKPGATIGQGVDISAPLRTALADGLRAGGAQVVMLEATNPGQAAAEAAQKNCQFVLYARASQGKSGAMSMGKKMSMIMPRKPKESDSLFAQPTDEDLKSLASTERVVVKSGDAFSLEYHVMARGADVSTGTLEGKAQKDGDDVLGPLVAQLSTAVINTANGRATTTNTTAAAATGAPQSSAGGSKAQSGRGKSGSTNQQGMPPNMDCDQMAAASHGSITVDACKQMMGAQQARAAALADPRASRPGDDKMTCDQIVAEVKQQQIAKPDAAKVAEAQAAATDVQKTAAKQQAEVTAEVIKESAEAAAELPKRMFEPNAVAAAEAKKQEAKQKEMNERMAAEMQPKMQREMTATANLAGDFSQQLTDNPRLAKLFEMANQKRCKIQ